MCKRVAIGMAAALALGVLAALLVGYQHPAMLVDFTNLIFCG